MKPDNFTSSFLELREKLFRSAMRFLRNDEDAKDVVQDSYLKLLKYEEFKSNKELQNKLFTVLKNLCIDRLRKIKPLPLSEVSLDSSSVDQTPEDEINDFEIFMTAGLTDFQKEIYTSIIKEGMSYEEIAEKFNMKIEAVRMNMSRIRRKIRENIKKYDL